jgi:hypothetical protein
LLHVGDSPDGPALFVATDLDSFESIAAAPFATDLTIDGRAYRRLDGPYYAWLRARVAAAKRALDAGRITAAVFEAIRGAFNAIHAWAVLHLGESALVAAARTLDPRRYEPPRPEDDLPPCRARRPKSPPGPSSGHAFPAQGEWPLTEQVTADAVSQVDAIRAEALALGWTDTALYRNRGHRPFPFDDYGLVCFVGVDARIEAVTREAVTLRHARGRSHRFPNPDVEQPWRRAAQIGAA